MFISLIILVIVVCSIASAGQSKIIVCNSVSCKWNKLCRCTRNKISVYDNTVHGLCFHHTESMKERILDPMQGKRIIESSGDSEFGKKMLDNIMKLHEEKLLKDPDAFANWMGKAIRKRNRG